MDWKDIKTKGFLLLLGFLLTGVVGSFISHQNQKTANLHAWDLRRLDYKIARADNLREKVSTSLDGRIYAMYRVILALEKNDIPKLKAEYAIYETEMRNWNKQLNSNLAEIDIVFSDKAYETFSKDIQRDGFIPLGIELEKAYSEKLNAKISQEKIQDLKKKQDTLYQHIYYFIILIQSEYNEMTNLDFSKTSQE